MCSFDEGRLKQWLSKYINPEVTLRDILSVTNYYQGLVPVQDIYTFNDGTPRDLVNLNGTVPVRYKGSVYNIPICIWLMDTHPKNAPICYVKPTSDMSIKVSMFVDQNGKIYLPYLHDWLPNSSDLLGLIQVMICTFGEQPPVFAKPKDSDIPYPSNSFMPLPKVGNSYLPYTPSFPQPPGGFGSMPPYPPASSTPSFPSYPSYPPSPYPPYPGGNFGNATPAVPGATGTIKDEHIRESLMTAIEEKLLRLMKEQFQQNQAELETLKRTQEELRQGKAKLDTILTKLEKEQRRNSLLEKVEGRVSMAERCQRINPLLGNREGERASRVLQQLNAARGETDRESPNPEGNDLDRNITLLQDKEQELDKAIERLSNQEEIDVDDAVITTAPLYKQLLNAFAEEAALEDAIYYMGEALRCSVIDLDIFLKQVRTLSRKQFMLRALMQKCRQKAGLSV